MINFNNICKTYDAGRTWAVRDLDLEIIDGELLVLVGESGSGKTTTLQMINRIITPSSGELLIDGEDVSGVDPVHLRRHTGYVFQEIGLFPHWSVARNIGAVPRLLGWSATRITERVEELLELVGLPPAEYTDRSVQQLSGGQQQRVGIARALAAQPKLMLMDEPFGALDPVTRDDLQTEFLNLHRRLGLTVVLVTHDMTEALLMADRIAIMREGRLLRADTPSGLLTNPGDPDVERLLRHPQHQMQRLEDLFNEQ